MLMVNQLIGFGASSSAPSVSTLVDRTTGTNFGDMTSNGGLAAQWNGVTGEAHGSCGSKATGDGSFGYSGKTFGAGKIVDKLVVYPSSTLGFSADDGANVVIAIYGKNGAPANSTDGTLLGTTSAADQTTGSRTVTSTDAVNSYTSIWMRVSCAGSTSMHVSEIEIYELL